MKRTAPVVLVTAGLLVLLSSYVWSTVRMSTGFWIAIGIAVFVAIAAAIGNHVEQGKGNAEQE